MGDTAGGVLETNSSTAPDVGYGTWELDNYEFAPFSMAINTATPISEWVENLNGYTFTSLVVQRYRDTIFFNLAGERLDGNLIYHEQVCRISEEKLGLAIVRYSHVGTVTGFVRAKDGAYKGPLIGYCNRYAQGVTMTLNSVAEIPGPYTVNFYGTYTTMKAERLISACDRFEWVRTA